MTHGHRRGDNGQRSPTYNSWRAAKERCSNPRHPFWPDYGGRGIKVCERWLGRDGFAHFLEDMGERPDEKTLDREDPNRDYEPANCRWATKIQQRWNRRDMAMRAVLPGLDYEEPEVRPVVPTSPDMPF